jgi:hypothetical protein
MAFERGSVLRPVMIAVLALGLAGVAGCASRGSGPRVMQSQEDEGGFPFSFGLGRGKAPAAESSAGIGVNSYLWRATLDTLSFMQLASADPYGGVVITDWYVNPEKPDERFKATVYILDTRLRADGLNVTVFKQTGVNGAWVDAAASPQTETDLENAILTRARQLRLANINN